MGLFDKINKKSDKNNNNAKSSKSEGSEGFKYLDKLIHSGAKEISLDCDIELKSNLLNVEEKVYLYGINLDVDDLVIDGNGHTIDAKGKIRIFNSSGKNITIKNLTLKNGFAPKNSWGNALGGAIYTSSDCLNIHDSVFSNNIADRGGAIDGSKLNISNTTFNSNKALEGNGGAIAAGKLNISNSTFNSNKAVNGSGGAISPGSMLNASDSTFYNNSAKYEGGAIRVENCDFNIERCEFHNNKADEGGAISDRGPIGYVPTFTVYDNVFDIKESIFKNNSSEYRGGAIISRNMINLYDCEIVDNTCNNNIIHSWGNVKIFNCKILNNKANEHIIYNEDSLQINSTEFKANKSENIISNSSNMSISNCKFRENDVDEAVVDTWGDHCTIEKSIFENNLSNEYSNNIINHGELTLTNLKIKDEGQTVSNTGQIFIKNSSHDLSSKIDGYGEVESSDAIVPEEKKFDFGYLDKIIHESTTKEIILKENISLEKYEAEFYEGGIELDIDDLIIDGNGKTIDGAEKSRIFIVTGKNITLKNITFKNGRSFHNYENPLNNHGGALRINKIADLTMKNCKFKDNASEENGAAIYNKGILNISKSKISNNTSEEFAGAIYNIYGLLNITKSVLSNNSAKRGGAIYNAHANSNISQSTVLNNTSSTTPSLGSVGLGGGIFNHDGNLIISESIFSDNIGGEIYNDEGDLTISKSTFAKNESNNDTVTTIKTVEKGIDKVFEFISNEMGPRHISTSKELNIDEIENNPIKYVNIKDCTFKDHTRYDISSETIDLESEYLEGYDINDILGYDYFNSS